jgi:hypothetical protein
MSNCSCRLVQSIEPSMESELKNFATVSTNNNLSIKNWGR